MFDRFAFRGGNDAPDDRQRRSECSAPSIDPTGEFIFDFFVGVRIISLRVSCVQLGVCQCDCQPAAPASLSKYASAHQGPPRQANTHLCYYDSS